MWQADNKQLDRRSLLTRSALGIGSLGLASLMHSEGYGALDGDDLLGSKMSHFPGKTKRVIHFFLNGGPSHVDTFDPKPALAKYAGKPVPNNLTTERKTGLHSLRPLSFRSMARAGWRLAIYFRRPRSTPMISR